MASSEIDLSGKAILVVDDDANYRRRVAEILKLLQAKIVYEAENGSEALGIFFEEDIDVIISDYHMPFMDGAEMIGKMRGHESKNHNPNKIIIILWSSNRSLISESFAIQLSRLCSLNSFVQKPNSIRGIIETIRHIK